MAIWNDIEALAKLARILPYILILFGFVIAASGQFFKSIVDARIGELESVALIAHKSTSPEIKAFLAHSARSGKRLLVIDVGNEIPFKANWLVVTENDQLVSPLMTGQEEIFPTKDKRRFSTEITINADKVTNEYIELRFRVRVRILRGNERSTTPTRGDHREVQIFKRDRFYGGPAL